MIDYIIISLIYSPRSKQPILLIKQYFKLIKVLKIRSERGTELYTELMIYMS